MITAFSISFNRDGENTLENFAQQMTGRKKLVFMLDHRKCNRRPSFVSNVGQDENNLNRHKDNTNHSKRKSLRSVLLLSFLQHGISIVKVVLSPTGHVPCALGASDGLPVETDKAKLVHVPKIDHFEKQRPELGFTVLDERV